MKTKFIIIAIALFLLGLLLISLSPSQTLIGPHGGTMKNVGAYNIEMKQSYAHFSTYLFDSKIKPISYNSLSCEVKFIMQNELNITKELTPFGEDGFAYEEVVPNFITCKITYNYFGKIISARFDNEVAIVKD